MQKQWFPSIGQSLLNLQPGWLATPWWPGDTLRVKQRSLIRILALAHREHLDPQPLIKNLAKGHRGRYRRRLNRLYRRIASGTPILKALEQVPNAISDHDLLALQLGMNTGSLTTTYDRLIQSYGTRADHDSDNRKNTQIYFASLSLIFLLGISFIITFRFSFFCNNLSKKLCYSKIFFVKKSSSFQIFVHFKFHPNLFSHFTEVKLT